MYICKANQNAHLNRTAMKHYAIAMLMTAALLAACGENGDDRAAQALVDRAEAEFRANDYTKALLTIDSMRHAYPGAIEARKRALRLQQDVSLKQAQEDLAATDSALQAVKRDYDTLKVKVEADRAALRATEEELHRLNLTRVKLDSLQVRFDMQCAKIKYIHKQQEKE